MKVFELFEEEHPPKQLFQWLWEHCAPFLRELGIDPKDGLRDIYDKAFLLRGLSTVNDKAKGMHIDFLTSWGDEVEGTIAPVAKNRVPRDTHFDLSKVIDDMLEFKFDWRPRESSIFCTGSLVQARSYGKAYRVFPMGEFKYVWSPQVRDITNQIPQLLQKAGIDNRDVEAEYTTDELAEFYEVLSDTYESSFKDTDLLQAIASKHEIMVSSERYLAIPLFA